MIRINDPYAKSKEEVLDALGVSGIDGLESREAKRRLGIDGRNTLGESKPVSARVILSNQFRSLIILLLIGAAAISFAFGDWPEGVAILIVILINTAIGFFTELKAVRSMEALNKLVGSETSVRRGGETIVIPSDEIVQGDIVILEAGDIVPADMRFIKASGVEADESSLTGESVPVSKGTDPVGGEPALADRTSMAFMGTALTRGSGEGVVTATGRKTELGRIGTLVEGVEHEKTPLEKSLDRLGNNLIWATLALAALAIGSGIARGRDTLLMVETGIALAVAAIPEGLPVVATIALARGMLRMAARNALVNRLGAVETLGSTSVICTDKTGTLTENKMTVERIDTEGATVEIRSGEDPGDAEFTINGDTADPLTHDAVRRALEAGVLCSTASLDDGGEAGTGDPMETAILTAAAVAGIKKPEILSRFPETRLEAFDSSVNMMATFHSSDGSFRVAVKGAPDAVLRVSSSVLASGGEKELADESRGEWLGKNDELASRGYRVIAAAEKYTRNPGEEPYRDLTFLGLLSLLDPPRPDVRESIQKCIGAGIKVVMVTGDHPATAKNIAQAVGLVQSEGARALHGSFLKNIKGLSEEEIDIVSDSLVIARVSPEQKLELVSFKQGKGFVVAMTGDGVNDAPALKQADIGIAMGLRGTQVAREAADIVLKDDSFQTIVVAIEQGRIIYGNIKKFIFYLISCNVSEILTVSVASFTLLPLPLLPLQILFLNLVTDVFPALALGMGEGGQGVMKSPPRDPKEPIISARGWAAILSYGGLLTVSVLGALLIAVYRLGYEGEKAVTVSFLTLAFAQLFHVFNMRDRGSGLFGNEITKNKYVWASLALCALLIVGAVYIDTLSAVLGVEPPGREGWTLVLVMSLVPLAAGQLLKLLPAPRRL